MRGSDLSWRRGFPATPLPLELCTGCTPYRCSECLALPTDRRRKAKESPAPCDIDGGEEEEDKEAEEEEEEEEVFEAHNLCTTLRIT